MMKIANGQAVGFDLLRIFDQEQDCFLVVHYHHCFFVNLAFCRNAFFYQFLCFKPGTGFSFKAAGIIGQIDQKALTNCRA